VTNLDLRSLSRRRCLHCLGAGAAWLACRPLRAAMPTSARRQPNFVLLLSDDQGWNGLSVAMDPAVEGSRSRFHQTPNLEGLAREGMRFARAYAPSPVCSPTRYSLQTGKSPAALHMTKAAPVFTAEDNFRLIPPRHVREIADAETTVAEILKQVGYATAHYGKWHLRGGGPGRHGYDEHDGDTSNRDAERFGGDNPVDIFGMTRRACAFIGRQVAADTPFFVQLSYHALHYSEQALKATQEKYRRLKPDADRRAVQIAAMTENLDTGVGHLLAHLDRLGIAQNTYVVYMSDNGAGGRGANSPLAGGKGSLLEGGIRVPLIIRGPGVTAGAVCRVPVVGFDLLPTVCELGGVRHLPPGVEGGSLTPLFANPKTGEVRRPRKEIVFHFPHYQGRGVGPHSAIILGSCKLLHTYEDDRVQLFDLSKDLSEQRDLAGAMPEKAAELKAALADYLKAVGAQMPIRNPRYDPAKPTGAPHAGRRRSSAERGPSLFRGTRPSRLRLIS